MKIRLVYLLVSLALPLQLFALGLGEIRVYSHLNEPFVAEIPLTEVGHHPLNTMKASMASEDEFSRLGLRRDAALSQLDVQVSKNKSGQVVISLVSQTPIKTAYLEMVVDLVWSEGELYRAFTVLLDPSIEETKTQGVLDPSPTQRIPDNEVLTNTGVAKEEQGTWFTQSGENQGQPPLSSRYGPTLLNETIWQIAKRYQTGELTLPQVVLAIVGKNPDAFEAGNLNGLKVASQLLIPSVEKRRAIPLGIAAQEVEMHDIAWRSHSPIAHILPPPYLQHINVLHSSLPEVPIFSPAVDALTPRILDLEHTAHEEKAHEVRDTQPARSHRGGVGPKPNLQLGWPLAEQALFASISDEAAYLFIEHLHYLEQANRHLTHQLAHQSQENRTLNQKLQRLEAQPGSRPISVWQSSGWVWISLLLFSGILGAGYVFWCRYHALELSGEPSVDEEKTKMSTLDEDQCITPKPCGMTAGSMDLETSRDLAIKTRDVGVVSEKMTRPHALVKSSAAIETLLQLAKMYISRGDLQVAQRSLEEVLAFGDQKQEAEARLLIEQIQAKHHLSVSCASMANS